ncbi:hypothetical protein AKJ08_2882 [Vulgatibacter incomptus]|uniref:Uncharacterized protein n=1 Tax=Vulgatibacter incomptus TaxID=1391653 RepID=A0A0K1PG52_9BACT|nr:hypothetical protein AKJ08_2882 [Vulgatibacter incomptus]
MSDRSYSSSLSSGPLGRDPSLLFSSTSHLLLGPALRRGASFTPT